MTKTKGGGVARDEKEEAFPRSKEDTSDQWDQTKQTPTQTKTGVYRRLIWNIMERKGND